MKFRRKPTVIEAVQFTDENEDEVYQLYGEGGFDLLGDGDGWMLAFQTAHGDTAYARPGDWIVPDSEPMTFYPIKDDVFQASYEPFDYDEEIAEESDIETVLNTVRSKLMQVMPMGQVDLAIQKLRES